MPGTLDIPKKKAVLIDIDGTLVVKDTEEPIPHTVDLVKKIADKYKIIICTFRKEKKRKKTIALLRKLGVPFDQLVMRPKTYGDQVEPWVYKSAAAATYQQKYIVLFAVDDNLETNKAYEKMGIEAHTPEEVEKKMSSLTKFGWTGYTF
jgi:ribonucleotide monophosphatase NagD (HAD superfamily)